MELPIINGVFAFVGENCSGKSTLLQAFAQLIRPQNALFSLKYNDYSIDSSINFKGLDYEDNWIVGSDNRWRNTISANFVFLYINKKRFKRPFNNRGGIHNKFVTNPVFAHFYRKFCIKKAALNAAK